jgi:NAD-dependent deacetylase
MDETCELGSPLRPHVVWFGEAVPMLEQASIICSEADVFIIIGTSLAVYPAAGLTDFVPYDAVKVIIDPKNTKVKSVYKWTVIAKKATVGVPEFVNNLLKD